MVDLFLHALREGLGLVLIGVAPPLLAAIVVGVAAQVIQGALRIEERSLPVGPRIVAALLAMAVAGPSFAAQLRRFTEAILAALPALARG